MELQNLWKRATDTFCIPAFIAQCITCSIFYVFTINYTHFLKYDVHYFVYLASEIEA